MSTRAQRYREGKDLRGACPRSSHAGWKAPANRPDPVATIEASNAGRVRGLVPLRYARMALSPFAFLRGAAIVQAADLAHSPTSGAQVQLCGDAHLVNFGCFGTPERNLIFDVNDFDETFPGPWEWDVKRLVTSVVLAARHRKFSHHHARAAVCATVESYRTRMSHYAQSPVIDVWDTQIDLHALEKLIGHAPPTLGSLESAAEDALAHSNEGVYPTWTRTGVAQPAIVDNPPFVYHFGRDERRWKTEMPALFARYRESLLGSWKTLFDHYRFEDIAVKVVGVGSVGTRCAVALFLSDDADPLFLQIKQANRSVLERGRAASRYPHQGERVVAAQRLMQAATDSFLGWAELPGSHDYYVRQLRDMRVTADVESFKPKALTEYSVLCGWALARAHAKSGDAPTIAGYLGKNDRFDRALVEYACAYADQVEDDFAAFKEAIASGRLTAGPNPGPIDFLP